MIQVVLFDFGGVLSTGGQDVRNSLANMLGVDPDAVNLDVLHEDYRRGLMSTDKFFTEFGKMHKAQVTAQDFNRSSDIFNRSKPVYELAKRLRQKNIRTGILSNIYPITAQVLRERGFYDGFKPVFLSCEEHFAKPDREFYEIAIAGLEVQASEILFIDDQEKCLPPARALGMKVIKAESPQQIVDDVKVLIRKENDIMI